MLFNPITRLFAQVDSLKATSLNEVKVMSTRIPAAKDELPYSITRIDIGKAKNSMQQLSLNEYLFDVPGVFTLNSNNFAQDMRVSIRGFGARSAFGIRGVKIIVDGIPETTPDGQGQIDNLNLDIIDNIEIIRGASSTLYGNASGGVISINTQNTVDKNFFRPAVNFGSFGMRQVQLSSGLRKGKADYFFHGSSLKTDGYRDQSGFETYNFNARMNYQLQENSKLHFQLNYVNSPYAGDSGGLTDEERLENGQQARQRNLDFNTRESVEQLKLGTSFKKIFDHSEVQAYGFYIARDFWASLPFENGGIVSLARSYFGQGLNYSADGRLSNWNYKMQLGYDYADQRDHRMRFQNLAGEQSDKSFGQDESFRNLGAFVLSNISRDAWRISLGIRYDMNLLSAQDLFLVDQDQSGEIEFHTYSPSFGISYELLERHFIHANFSTGFETPTLSELSANPNGLGGFNRIQPQFAKNYELGYKTSNLKTSVEASIFYIESKGDLIPYETAEFPGRSFYRNAGIINRRGFEIAASHKINDKIKTNISYTYSDFKYGSFVLPDGDLNGKTLPGLPPHLATLGIHFKAATWASVRFNSQYRGQLYVNDANDFKENDFVLLNINAQFKWRINKFTLLPYLGVNNVFDAQYSDNIRINAFGRRYFEPGPGVNLYVGLRANL